MSVRWMFVNVAPPPFDEISFTFRKQKNTSVFSLQNYSTVWRVFMQLNPAKIIFVLKNISVFPVSYRRLNNNTKDNSEFFAHVS